MAIAALYVRYQCPRCADVLKDAIQESLVTSRAEIKDLLKGQVAHERLCPKCGAWAALTRGAVPRNFPHGHFTTKGRMWYPMSFYFKGKSVPDLDANGLLRLLDVKQTQTPELCKAVCSSVRAPP